MLSRWRGRLYVLLPLLLLGIDLLVKPKVTGQGEKPQPVNTVQLLINKRLHLGTFRTHPIEVAYDSVADPQYLAAVRGSASNAVVVSSFIDTEDLKQPVVIGEFGRAILTNLKRLAPAEEKRLRDFIAKGGDYQPGDVRDFELHLAKQARDAFPVDRIFVTILARGTGEENAERKAFENVMTRVVERAQQTGVRNVVVPVIGYNRADKNTVELKRVFRSLLAAMNPSTEPAAVVIDLYSGWPTPTLENAVAALNAAVSQVPAEATAKRFYRQRVRALYLLLIICLFSTSFVIPLTWRTVTIVGMAFTGTYLGLERVVEPFTADLSARARVVVEAIAYLGLAALFPIVIRWDPHGLFKTGRTRRGRN